MNEFYPKRLRLPSRTTTSRARSLIESLEPRMLMSATLFADAGPDQTADEGATINVAGSFNDTDPGTPGTFNVAQLSASDGVGASQVAIDGNNVAWNDNATIRLNDGTTTIDLATGTSTNFGGLDIDGDRVAFGIGNELTVYTISTGSSVSLQTGVTNLANVNIDGDIVTWQKQNGAFISSFFTDLSDPGLAVQQIAAVADPGGAGSVTNPLVEGGVIYYIGSGSGGFTDVFARDLTSGNFYNVSNTPTQGDQNIAADNGVVAWNTVSSGSLFSDVYVFDGRGYDGTGPVPTNSGPLDGLGGFDIFPDVSGANVVWESAFGAPRDIFLYNVDTATQSAITTDGSAARDIFPAIEGSSVVWANTAGDVVFYDLNDAPIPANFQTLNAGFPFAITTNSGPFISGGNIAFLSGSGTAREVILVEGQGSATYSFDWDFGDGTVLTDVSLNEAHAYLDNGTYTVTLTVTSSNGDIATDTATITVNNLAPELTGLSLDSASVDEGGSVTLSGSFSDAGVLDTHTVTIDWGDGTTSNATVDQVAGTFSATNTYLDDAPTGTASDLASIGVTLADNDGGGDLGNESVTVNNLAPVVGALTGPTQAVRGQTLSYAGSFTDAGTLDTHTESWTVTDASNTVIATGTGSTFDYAPDTLGSFTVTYTVTDDDTGEGDGTLSLTTELIVVTADPVDPSQTSLLIGGGDNSELIKVFGRSDGLKVKTYDFTTGELNIESGIQADRIIAYGNGGNDYIKVFNSAGDIDADIFGGEGNDWLRGGKGDDTIVGGNGNDFIGGHNGRDLLIGGDGTDFVIGHRHDDILIAGSYTGQNDLASLRAIMALWTSPDDYATRVGSLSPLLNDTTVSDDNNFDLLLGLQGSDYFLYNDQQDLTDQRRNELMTDTEIDFLDGEVEDV